MTRRRVAVAALLAVLTAGCAAPDGGAGQAATEAGGGEAHTVDLDHVPGPTPTPTPTLTPAPGQPLVVDADIVGPVYVAMVAVSVPLRVVVRHDGLYDSAEAHAEDGVPVGVRWLSHGEVYDEMELTARAPGRWTVHVELGVPAGVGHPDDQVDVTLLATTPRAG